MKGHVEAGKLVLSGALELDYVDLLLLLLRESLAGEGATAEPLQVDLAEVTDVDTAALQVFVSARRTAEQAGRSLVLVSANEKVRERFRLTGLDFLLEPSVEPCLSGCLPIW
ncbi:MAG: STAS domain-containing protein [Magnetococcales bacterium]|nr:STAS domain-containing protein [Magnetococcales bacterium]